MKKTLNSFIDLILTLIVCIPFFYLFEWIGYRRDWLDILLTGAASSVVFIAATILLKRLKGCSIIKEIVKGAATIVTSTTLIYAGFTLFEYIFPMSKDNGFTGNWVQWLCMSFSLTIFFYFQEKRKEQSKKNGNNLAVVAEYSNMTEAEATCRTLEINDIKAMSVEKGNPMYIPNSNNVAVQVQVLSKDIQKAKELIK